MTRKTTVKKPRKPASKKADGKAVTKPATPAKVGSKKDTILALLRRKSGASIAEITSATGWQPHSARGFLSGKVKKKLGINLSAKSDAKGVRRCYAAAK